jgi:membrane associated rhomboid family serine protease
MDTKGTSDFTPVCYRHSDRETGLSCTECGKPICTDCSRDAAVGQKCPECARPIGRNRVVTARSMRRNTPVVTVILAATIVAYFAQGSVPGFENDFLQSNVAIRNGEWWRLLTSAFLHGGIMHIAFNMYALWIFGPSLERQVGSAPFAALYGASALFGGAAYLLLGDRNGFALGASGAIFGLFGAWFAAAWKSRHTPAGNAQFRQLLGLLALNLMLPLIIPRIAWQAHVGGLLAGAGIMLVWLRIPPGPRRETTRTIIGVGFALVALGLALVA